MKPLLSYRIDPVPGTTFYLLGEQKGIFCEPKQRLYALNDMAAFIWCCLDEGQQFASIVDALTARGLTPDLAKEYVREAIYRWLRRGLLQATYSFAQSFHDALRFRLDLKAANFGLTVRAANQTLVNSLQDVLGHLQVDPIPQAELWIVELDGSIHGIQNGTNLFCCSVDELVPIVKALISDQIVATCAPDVAFHGASLARKGKCLMISGKSGAGKTTLALRLLESGFDFCADDISLISHDGRAKGVPLAPAAKSGAWKLISQFRPDLGALPVHLRRDGKRVRFIMPRSFATAEPRTVAWLVFLKRAAVAEATLTRLEPNDVMARIVEASFLRNSRLDLPAFNAIKQTVMNAAAFELTYLDLEQANNAIVSLCDER